MRRSRLPLARRRRSRSCPRQLPPRTACVSTAGAATTSPPARSLWTTCRAWASISNPTMLRCFRARTVSMLFTYRSCNQQRRTSGPPSDLFIGPVEPVCNHPQTKPCFKVRPTSPRSHAYHTAAAPPPSSQSQRRPARSRIRYRFR
jgi:hypothetical protein